MNQKLFFLSFRGLGAMHIMGRDFGDARARAIAIVPEAAHVEAIGGHLDFDDPESAFFDVPEDIKAKAKDPANHNRLMSAEEIEAMGGDIAPDEDVERAIKEHSVRWEDMQ